MIEVEIIGEEKRCDDCISRQAAIDAAIEAADEWDGGYSLTRAEMIENKLKDLPSAQPEPCDDPRADVYYLAEKIGIHQLYALVVELRGEPEPCEDAVNRRKLLNDLGELITAWKKYPVMAEQIKGVETAIEYVETIPSVMPKPNEGKWIELTDCANEGVYCSECHKKVFRVDFSNTMKLKNFKYCPNCGSYNGGK